MMAPHSPFWEPVRDYYGDEPEEIKDWAIKGRPFTLGISKLYFCKKPDGKYFMYGGPYDFCRNYSTL